LFSGAAFYTYLADRVDEPFEIVGGAGHPEDAAGAGGADLLWGLVEVAAFATYD